MQYSVFIHSLCVLQLQSRLYGLASSLSESQQPLMSRDYFYAPFGDSVCVEVEYSWKLSMLIVTLHPLKDDDIDSLRPTLDEVCCHPILVTMYPPIESFSSIVCCCCCSVDWTCVNTINETICVV